MSWNLTWNFGEIFRATFSRVSVCDGKFHQNFTSKTVWKTENFTQISLCRGAALTVVNYYDRSIFSMTRFLGKEGPVASHPGPPCSTYLGSSERGGVAALLPARGVAGSVDLRTKRAQRSKKFDPDRNFWSRSKFLISLENFNLDVSISPQKNRAAVGGSLEKFILARNLQSRSRTRIFLIFGPSGKPCCCC